MYVIAYDIGTTGLKSCLFDIRKGEPIRLVADASENYDLIMIGGGGVEQDPLDWWKAMGRTTRELLEANHLTPGEINGISFCAQMQAVVLVDSKGEPVRNAMSYMDSRAGEQIAKSLHKGLKIQGMNASVLLHSLKETGAVSASVKDPVWKYRWVADREPEIYQKTYKWLDAKDFLVCRATGRFTMSRDSAFGTLLYDTRPGKRCFSQRICKMLDVDRDHLPEIVESADLVGGLTAEAAAELGLAQGTPVFSGGGDASLIGVGAGAVDIGDTHVYIGTSGWVGTVIGKQKLDIGSMIASIVGADPDCFLCFAELDTAGKCFEWARDRLFAGAYSFTELGQRIQSVPAGSHGVVFTPWMHGNRCPFEDPNARSMFFGIGLETTPEDLYRAVVEGVCLHLRWQMQAMDKLIPSSDVIRLAGGGARTPQICQILADVTGKKVQVIASPQNAGSTGAAAVMAVGLGEIESLKQVKDMIVVTQVYDPDPAAHHMYDDIFQVFCDLYRKNKKNFLKAGGWR